MCRLAFAGGEQGLRGIYITSINLIFCFYGIMVLSSQQCSMMAAFSLLLLHKPMWKGAEKICHWCIVAGNADCAGSILGVH